MLSAKSVSVSSSSGKFPAGTWDIRSIINMAINVMGHGKTHCCGQNELKHGATFPFVFLTFMKIR